MERDPGPEDQARRWHGEEDMILLEDEEDTGDDEMIALYDDDDV